MFKENPNTFNMNESRTHIGYRADIDGLRAIAVLSVMTYHLNAHWLTGGFIGVDVFFVISGFVVTGALVKSRATSAISFIGEFYARRLARIMPALVLVLCFTVLLATCFIPNAWLSQFSRRTALYAFFGLGNWVMQTNNDTYFAPLAEFNPYTHTWSLGVEEQFYLVVPIIVFLWLRTRRASHASHVQFYFIGLLFILCAASLAGSLYMTHAKPTVAFYFFGFRFWELGLGVLLYLLTSGRIRSDLPLVPFFNSLLPWIGVLLIGFACFLAKADHFPWPWAMPAVCGTLLVIGGVHADVATPVRRLLALPPFLWIGKRSYSLYLWHWPIYVLLRWTIGLDTWPIKIFAVVATFVFGTLSYHYVETPLRHPARIEAWRPLFRIAFFAAFTAIGWWSAKHVLENPARYSLSTVTRHGSDWYVGLQMPDVNPAERPCAVEVQYADIGGGQQIRYVPHNCSGPPASEAVYVIGDSHATAYLPMYDQLCADTGRTIYVYGSPGCSYIDFFAPMLHGRSPGCIKFNQVVQKHVFDTAKAGDLVFLPGLRIYRYCDQSANTSQDVFQSMYNPAANELREAAMEEAKQLLRPFAEKKLWIIFEAPKPLFKAPPFRCSDWFNRMNPICLGNNQQSSSEMQRLREPILGGMDNLCHLFDKVSVWDPFPILCPGNVCSTQENGRPLFFDGDHLSAYANKVLYPHFKTYIDSLIAKP